MRKIRIISMITAMCVLFALLFTACEEDDGKGYIFGYDISSNPSTLDPQCADDDNSFMLIGTMFEGLVKCDTDGNIIPAGAESWTASEDGLTYTFTLAEDRYWTDVNGYEAKCVAADYVYGFVRLFIPETRAAGASRFFCIRNSEKINSGALTDVSQLGVRAEGDYTLVIELEYADPQFLRLLSTAPAMPCNEEYFLAAQGKYGLTAKTTPSNGAFYLKSWDYDPWSTENNNLVMRYNEKYSEQNEVCPLGLNFFITDTSNYVPDFLSDLIQNVPCEGSAAEDLAEQGYSYEEFSTGVYGLITNSRTSALKNSYLRYALLYAADTSGLTLPFGFSTANAAVPPVVRMGEQSYRDYAGSMFVRADTVRAESSYAKALEQVDKDEIHSIGIIAMTGRDEEIAEAVKSIMQQWQAKLGFFCTLTMLGEYEYEEAVKSGDYDIALVRYSGGYNSPDSYLKMFTADKYYFSSPGAEYSQALAKAENAATDEECYSYCVQAEGALLSSGCFIPIAYASEYFFSAEGCEGVSYNPFTGMIDYSKALYFD